MILALRNKNSLTYFAGLNQLGIFEPVQMLGNSGNAHAQNVA